MKSLSPTAAQALRERIATRYGLPSAARATFQVVTTSLLLVALWAAMLWSLDVSYWITLALAVPTAGLLIRLFIIQHDCGHGSFVKSTRWNDFIGSCIGVLTLTPYHYWRRTHALHHATSGNLDKRGAGDIDTLTVREYLELSPAQRLRYRIYRSPLVLFVFGAVFHFAVRHRWPSDMRRRWDAERFGVLATNGAIVALVVAGGLLFGWREFLLVQAPITILSCMSGVWLFYVQHQYEGTYWRRDGEWNFDMAGLEGSSYYRLPRTLQWFTGNIGLHHVHHLSSRIPNYRLERCLRENPELHEVTTLTLASSLRCAGLKLWDEDRRRLVGFREAERIAADRASAPAAASAPATARAAEPAAHAAG